MMETNPWRINAEKLVYNNPWISLTEYDVINPGGGKGIYGKVHFKNIAVGVLVLDHELNTYLVGQFRFTLNAYSWEMPEGGCPVGSDTLESARRELLEETGLVARDWSILFQMHLSNSVSDELAVIYLARDLQQFEAEPEETEQLQVKKLPFAELLEMVEKGEITDSMTVAAVYKVQLLLLQGKLN
ncbi:NUDIX domain-containing protein [Sediminibacterium salmoneum]|uniref:NUDIX domain-containing protein n=1 Tax=Sediminibacterium salmoneum TaxID=426421 RepID=UPI00047A07C5|nr:NUDIX hydrolase [Sediminibacterium salmoneum]